MDSEFFDTRLQFLSLCRGNHYQFDTLRRARYSSMVVLYHLHNPSEPAFPTTCNICKDELNPGQGYRCQQCPDFDMCCACYEDPNIAHEHALTPPNQRKFDETRMRLTKEDKQRRDRALKETLRLLLHASECRNVQDTPTHGETGNVCPQEGKTCMQIKSLLNHIDICRTKLMGGCLQCRNTWALLQAHSKACKVSDCQT